MTKRPIGPGEVKIYSNCDTVELFRNGESLGAKSGADCIFTWSGVSIRDGTNELKAVGRKGGKRFEDTCTLTGAANATTRFQETPG